MKTIHEKLMTVEFYTPGEDIEHEEFIAKMAIIDKYFPFEKVVGFYNCETSVSLHFDNGNAIFGQFDKAIDDEINVAFKIGETLHQINIHPFNGLGGLDKREFEKTIKTLSKSPDMHTLCLIHENYALFCVHFSNKEDLDQCIDDYRVIAIKGHVAEGRLIEANYL